MFPSCSPTCFQVKTVTQSPVKKIHFLGTSVCVIQADERLSMVPHRHAPIGPLLLISVWHVFHLACLMGGHGSLPQHFPLSCFYHQWRTALWGEGCMSYLLRLLLNGACVQNTFYSPFKLMTSGMHSPDLSREAKPAGLTSG